MSTNYRLERRRDRIAEREQDRADRIAERRIQARERREADQRARRERAEREAARQARRQQRRARRAHYLTALRSWASAHVVDLLIYPLALASAVMAVPAMADYGYQVYGGATGMVLPVISELGMWAFALATMASRRQHPQRPTHSFQVGIAVFAAVGLALNFAHGWTATHDAIDALVMSVVSIAGVSAHQLVTASARRTRGERVDRRVARLAQRRIARVRRLATRHAVAVVTATGDAELAYETGRFVPKRRHLDPVVGAGDGWDEALADLVREIGPVGGGSLERTTEADLRESGDGQSADGPIEQSGNPSDGEPADGPGPVDVMDRPKRRPIDPQARRNLSPAQELRRARAIARRKGKPVTTDEIRIPLEIAKKRAAQLRDIVNTELYGQER